MFDMRPALGVPWTLQFATPVLVGIGRVVIVGCEGFESDVELKDGLGGDLVSMARVVVMLAWYWPLSLAAKAELNADSGG